MRISLAGRLFVAMFGISAVTVAMVVGWTAWALNEGFSTYVSAQALAGMGDLTEALRRTYAAHGDWSGLAGKPQAWAALLTLARDPTPPFPPDGGPPEPGGPRFPPPGDVWLGGRGANPPPPLPPPERRMLTDRLLQRLALVDAARHPVAGDPSPGHHAARRAIIVNGREVGALLLDAGPMRGGSGSDFLAGRLRDFLLAGAVSLVLSAMAAIVLARSIVRPVRAVMIGARRLAASDFSARIERSPGGELGDLVSHFNALDTALDTAEQSRRLWVADTSHELRTPLAVLRAHIEAMQDGVQPVTPGALGILHGEVMRMTQLVADLHELSRADAGALSLHVEALEPAALLRSVLASFSALLQEKNLQLDESGLAACDAAVAADDGKLRQVFANLIENSIRYTDSGGFIRASAGRQDDSVVLRVEDSAPGVPPAKLPRIFERFYRGETSRNRGTGGSGLGLAISRAILEAHGGTITAGPSRLGGLAITIQLPVSP